MNYPQSQEILEKIKSSKKILMSCHETPDPDSVACNLMMKRLLTKLGVDSKIITVDDFPDEVKFLPGWEEIEVIDPEKFDYSDYDLFLLLDINVLGRVNRTDKPIVGCYKLVIDHHVDNSYFGDFNLVDTQASSASEMIYLLALDWGIEIDSTDATVILTGIYGDTEVFRYDITKPRALRITADLWELGAERDKVIFYLFRSRSFETLKYWGEMLQNMHIDENYKFVWSAMKYEDFKKFGELKKASSTFSSFFPRTVLGTNFGVTMHEGTKGNLSVSFRERNGIDVSDMAREIGGGGHKSASGAAVKGLPFDEAVEKVLAAARKYANQKYTPKAKDIRN